MDSPIAPSAMRRAEDGPAYDLVSLALVVFTILLVGVWTTHFFRQPPRDEVDFQNAIGGFDSIPSATTPSRLELTSTGNLQAARWADFNLRSAVENEVSPMFTKHLSTALEQEKQEHSFLVWRKTHGDDESRIEAAALLDAEEQAGGSPAWIYANEWYRIRSAWVDARDIESVNIKNHLDLAAILAELGMKSEAAAEIQKVRRARPDWPGPLK